MHPDHCVGQVRLIFQPHSTTRVANQPYLVYAQRYDCAHAAAGCDPNTGLFRLKCATRTHPTHGNIRLGAIIASTRIRCAADVVPYFGKKAHSALTAKLSMELSTSFNLNKYIDKESFRLLH